MPTPTGRATSHDWASLGVKPPTYVGEWSRLSSELLFDALVAVVVTLTLIAVRGEEGPLSASLAGIIAAIFAIAAIRKGITLIRKRRATPAAAEVVKLVPRLAEWCLLRPYVVARTEDDVYVVVPEDLGLLGVPTRKGYASALAQLALPYQAAYIITVVRPLSLTEVPSRPRLRIRWSRRLQWRRKSAPVITPLEFLTFMRGRFEIPSPSKAGHVLVGEGEIVQGVLVARGHRSPGAVAADALSLCFKAVAGELPPVSLAKVSVKR